MAQLNCDCGVVYSAEFDPVDVGTLVTGSEDGMVRVWDARPRELLFSAQVSQSLPWAGTSDGVGGVTYVAGLGDVTALASGVSISGEDTDPDKAVVIDLRTGRQTTVLDGPEPADMQSFSVSQARGAGGWPPPSGSWRWGPGPGEGVAGHQRRPRCGPGPTSPGLAPHTVARHPPGRLHQPGRLLGGCDLLEQQHRRGRRPRQWPGRQARRDRELRLFRQQMAFNAAGNRVLVSYNNGWHGSGA